MDFSNFDIKSFIEFDEEQAGRSLDKILKKLNKNYKLKLNIDFNGIDKIGQKLNGLNKKLNKNFNLDTTGATKSVEKIDNTIGRLEKKQLNLVDSQQVKEIEHIKENLIETKKIIHDLKDGKTSVVNIEDYRKLYNELSKLQKQEFAIKERMIGKDELYTQELQKQLDVVKQQKSELQELSSKYNIKGRESFDKDLLRQKLQMQSNLDLKQQEYNKKLQEENKEIERQINNYQKKKTAQLDIFKSRYKGLFNENEATNLQKAINNIKTDNLKDVRKQFQNIDADFKKLEANAKTSSKALKSTQKDVISTTELLSNSMKKFSLWVMAGGLSMKIFHFFTGGIRYAFDFNKALTEISTVTNQNQHQVEKLANGYSRLAKSMKVTKEEVIASSIEFYRQGLSQDQVMDRVKETTKFAKVSNLEFKESAELLTATVNSMNVDITKASDVFTYIGDATATSSDEISKGFQKIGGTASTLGVEFEKASSWLAVISARTREAPESIGTGLKSIMARYQQLTEKGYAEEDGTKVNNVAKALSVIGIKMTDAEGNFRNFGDVMDELGGKWGSLDNRTKSYISTCLAGTYQLSRFQNLMEGYGESVKLYENALNSAGTTQKKYNLWMKGTEAYLNGLKEEGTDIWRKVFDSEMLKRFIKTLTDSLKLVNLLIDKFGVLPTGIMTVSIVLSALNKNFRTNVAQKWFDFLDHRIVGTRRKIQMTNKTINGLKVAKAKDVLTVFGTPVKDINLKNIINGVGKQMKKMQLQVKKTRLEFQKAKAESGRLSGGLKVLKTSVGATTAKMKALAQSIKLTKIAVGGLKIAMTFGLSIAFDMMIDKIYKTTHRTQELREKLEDLEQTALSNIDNNNNNIRSLSEVSDEYNKLKKETSLSTDEQKRLHEIENQIANIMPEVVTGIDEQGNAMINLKGGIEGVVEALKEKNKQEKLALAGSWSDKQKQLQDDIAKEKKKIEKDKAKMKDALKQIEKGEAGRSKFSAKGDTGRVMYHEDQIEKGKTKVAELNAKIQESTSKIKELNAEAIPTIDAILTGTKGYNNLTDSAKKLMSILAKPKGANFKVTDAEKLMKIFSDNRIKETIKKLENLKMHPESVKNFNEELEKTVLLLLNLIKELSGEKINLDVQDIMNTFNLKEVNEELD